MRFFLAVLVLFFSTDAIGETQRVRVKYKEPIEGQKEKEAVTIIFTGSLQAIEENELVLGKKGEEKVIGISTIQSLQRATGKEKNHFKSGLVVGGAIGAIYLIAAATGGEFCLGGTAGASGSTRGVESGTRSCDPVDIEMEEAVRGAIAFTVLGAVVGLIWRSELWEPVTIQELRGLSWKPTLKNQSGRIVFNLRKNF